MVVSHVIKKGLRGLLKRQDDQTEKKMLSNLQGQVFKIIKENCSFKCLSHYFSLQNSFYLTTFVMTSVNEIPHRMSTIRNKKYIYMLKLLSI